MTDIQEIPLDITENITNIAHQGEDIPTIPEIVKDIPPSIEDVAAEIPEQLGVKPIKPKAKGRPKGAENKGPSKPRAKKTQIQEARVEEAYEVQEPTSPKRNLKIPTDPSTSDVAAAMLKLLQEQSYSRQTRKQRLYNSWFQ